MWTSVSDFNVDKLLSLTIDKSSIAFIIIQQQQIVYSNDKAKELCGVENFDSLSILGQNILSDLDFQKFEAIIKNTKLIYSNPISDIFSINEKRYNFVFHLLNIDDQTYAIEILPSFNSVTLSNFNIDLDTFLDNLPSAILILDDFGFIRFVNRAFLEMKNIQKDLIIGKNLESFDNLVYADAILPDLIKNFKEKTDYIADYKDVTRNGRVNNLRILFKNHFVSEEREYFFVLGYDISDEKRLQQNLDHFNNNLKLLIAQKTDELLAKTQKLEKSQSAMIYLLEDMQLIQKKLQETNTRMLVINKDLESFNYAASHDLRAPLRVINTYAKFLKRDCAHFLSVDQNEMLDAIISQSSQMAQLIIGLLDFSRTTNQNFMPMEIEMNELFTSIINEKNREFSDSNFFIEINDIPNAYGDYLAVKQVVTNLISNAFKFTAKSKSPHISVGSRIFQGSLFYYIKDNGIGMEEESQNRIFELFYRHENSKDYEGTGVGLAIVKRIIDKHRGDLYVKSGVDKGTEIGFTLKK